MIKFKHKGSFAKTEKFLSTAKQMQVLEILNTHGKRGVQLLASATPIDTGATAYSWEYEVKRTSRGYKLTWSNSNSVDGVVIALIIQYGHGTGNGGYVEGRDYINPVMQPLFDQITESLWKEVSKL